MTTLIGDAEAAIEAAIADAVDDTLFNLATHSIDTFVIDPLTPVWKRIQAQQLLYIARPVQPPCARLVNVVLTVQKRWFDPASITTRLMSGHQQRPC